jgi:hypothetical protein
MEDSLDFLSNSGLDRLKKVFSELVERNDLAMAIGLQNKFESHNRAEEIRWHRKERRGETGESHFIGTICCLSSDAESAVFLDFVAVLDVTDRCSASLMRNSNSSVPPVQLENPLSLLPQQRK